MKHNTWKSSEEADAWFRQLDGLNAEQVIQRLEYVREAREHENTATLFEYDTDHNHAWYLLGLAHEKLGDLTTAAKCFRVAAETWPSDADAYVAYSNTEPNARLQTEFLEAGLQHVDDPRIRFNLANAYFDLAAPENALRHLEAISGDWESYGEVVEAINLALSRIQQAGR